MNSRWLPGKARVSCCMEVWTLDGYTRWRTSRFSLPFGSPSSSFSGSERPKLSSIIVAFEKDSNSSVVCIGAVIPLAVVAFV
eukprot:4277317-Amphidinium_carterae.1